MEDRELGLAPDDVTGQRRSPRVGGPQDCRDGGSDPCRPSRPGAVCRPCTKCVPSQPSKSGPGVSPFPLGHDDDLRFLQCGWSTTCAGRALQLERLERCADQRKRSSIWSEIDEVMRWISAVAEPGWNRSFRAVVQAGCRRLARFTSPTGFEPCLHLERVPRPIPPPRRCHEMLVYLRVCFSSQPFFLRRRPVRRGAHAGPTC